MNWIFQSAAVDAMIFVASGFGMCGGYGLGLYLNRREQKRHRRLVRYCTRIEAELDFLRKRPPPRVVTVQSQGGRVVSIGDHGKSA
jgi:hypothetical protein